MYLSLSSLCRSADSSERIGGKKLQTCGMKGRSSETSLACPLHACERVRDGEREEVKKTNPSFYLWGSSFRSWKCTLVYFFFSEHRNAARCFFFFFFKAMRAQPAPVTLACACVLFPVASCQLLLDLASVTALSGCKGNNATARPTWAQCVPE